MASPPDKNIPFELLPEDIRSWIFSEGISSEVRKILDRLKPPKDKEHVLARLIGQVVVKDIESKNFVAELSRQLNISAIAAQQVGTEVKNSVLKPIVSSLWKNLKIDVNDFTKIPDQPAGPAAKVTKFDQSLTKPPNQQPAAPAQPMARVTEFKMTDVKRPAPPIGRNIKPKEDNGPAPDVLPTPKPFGLSEVVPEAPRPPTPPADNHPMKQP